MFTDEEMQAMMNVGESEPDTPETAQTTTEQPAAIEEPASGEQISVADVATPVQETSNIPSDTMTDDDSVSVSDIILNNVDKHIKMLLLNDAVHTANAEADVTNYIVYINTDKKIPCLYDCEGLYVPKASVMDANGAYTITSIEGRRSGFVIKTPERDLVMTKNFIYDCVITNGVITSVKQYNRKRKMEDVTATTPANDFDSASLLVQRVLPKIVKCGKYTTIEALREQVQRSYDSVNDINAMFKIIELRLNIGC